MEHKSDNGGSSVVGYITYRDSGEQHNIKQFRGPFEYARIQYYKGLSIYAAFSYYDNSAPRLLDEKAESFENLERETEFTINKGPVIQYSKIPGTPLSELIDRDIFVEPSILKEFFLNCIDQLSYIYNNTVSHEDPSLPYYHGDIHTDQVIVTQLEGNIEEGKDGFVSTLIDWDLVYGGNINFIIPPLALELFSREELEGYGYDVTQLRDEYEPLKGDKHLYYKGDIYSLTLVMAVSMIGKNSIKWAKDHNGGIVNPADILEVISDAYGEDVSKRFEEMFNYGLRDVIFDRSHPREMIKRFRDLFIAATTNTTNLQ